MRLARQLGPDRTGYFPDQGDSPVQPQPAPGIPQITETNLNLVKVTQSGAANSEEPAASTDDLSGLEKELNDMSRRLNRLVTGRDEQNGNMED